MTTHSCTEATCGPLVHVWCYTCCREYARVRMAHAREERERHDAVHTLRPTQRPGVA